MIVLQHPDNLHLQAAVGWLELGDHLEANEELEKITASLRAHPDVLVVRWQVYAKAEQWEGAFEIARSLVAMVPDFPNDWIYQAESLRRMPGQGVKGAWAALLPAADKFPKEAAILYNLACYSCLLGKIADAWAWLEMAFKVVGDQKQLKLRALNDRDLEQLWAEIREI
jgi:tetratricopeptide (TPR) repeat protein